MAALSSGIQYSGNSAKACSASICVASLENSNQLMKFIPSPTSRHFFAKRLQCRNNCLPSFKHFRQMRAEDCVLDDRRVPKSRRY